MRNYVGLGCTFHDPAFAIVDSKGTIVFAEGTERHQQTKRAFQCAPDDMSRLNELLSTYGEAGAEIVFAKSWSSQFESIQPGLLETYDAILANAPGAIDPSFDALLRAMGIDIRSVDSDGARYLANGYRWILGSNRPAIQVAGSNLRYRLREGMPGFQGAIVQRAYNHHLTHAATACYTSPFDEAVCAVIDGLGEGTSNTFYRYRDGRLTLLADSATRRGFGSLGLFYGHLCWACGFDPSRGEEWKVMGLAAYGKLNAQIYELLHSMLEHDTLALAWPADYAEKMSQLLTLRRRPKSSPLEAADLAFTGQQVFGEYFKALLDDLYELGESDNLVLGGGCALNSAWNGRILEETRFSSLHVFSAPADDGNAIGAALLAYHEDHPPTKAPASHQTPYLGSSVSSETLDLAVTLGGLLDALPPGQSVAEFTAGLLAAGKIVGWVQGRAEFGPRALGNRSILADPRDPKMKDWINARVKFREEFRPFAPSILHEHGPEYFQNYQEAPYMERTLVFRPEVRSRVPAVVHVDGTGRLQTVKREHNPRFHALICAFHELTGVPILLNTSFNVMGKPIIHSVEDALAVFFTSGLDALVIDDKVFLKESS